MTHSSAPSRFAHRSLSAVAVAFACATSSSVAFAQSTNPNCPPGSWFCADTQEKPAAPAGQPVPASGAGGAAGASGAGGAQPLQPLPAEKAPPQVTYAPAPQPPVVIYQPPPPAVIVREAPPPYYYTPRQPAPRRREWGLNLHLEGAMMGSKANSESGMGGAGFGLRYKPVPAFGLEADLDFVGGTDYQGYRRGETAFTLNGLIFVNPRSKTQLYFLAGFGWAGANVSNDNSGSYYASTTYKYFGGQVGAGLEFRLARHFAMNVDLRGFIRGRVDDNAQYQPEFYSNGRTTNTSGGGLLTVGMTFYF